MLTYWYQFNPSSQSKTLEDKEVASLCEKKIIFLVGYGVFFCTIKNSGGHARKDKVPRIFLKSWNGIVISHLLLVGGASLNF
jgi:hypothetical protein